MKKNIFKKIVASLATVAMAAGLFTAMPAEEAKADVRPATETKWKLKGTFTGWADVEMTASGNDYVYTVDVEEGAHEYMIYSDSTYVKMDGNKNFAFTADGDKKATITLKVDELGGPRHDGQGFYWGGTYYMTEETPGAYVTLADLESDDPTTGANDPTTGANDPTTGANDPTTGAKETTTVANDPTTGAKETTTVANSTTKAPETTTEAKKGVTVEVTLDASIKWDKVYLYAFSGNNGLSKWPGIEMTAKDGKWYATIDTELTKLSYVISAGEGKEQTADIADVSGKDVKITVSAEKNDKGHFIASAKTVTTGGTGTGSAKPGDTAPIVMMLAVAAVAAGMVVASKKTICE